MPDKVLLIIFAGVVVLLLICLMILLRPSDLLPKNRRKGAHFSGGAQSVDGRITNEMLGSSYKFMPEDRAGTVVVNVNIGKQNPLPILRIRNTLDGSCFDIQVNGSAVLGRHIQNTSGNFWGVSDDGTVSRSHCTVAVAGGQMYITDNNSSNHTYLNNAELSGSAVIHTGDRIRLGKTAEFDVEIYHL